MCGEKVQDEGGKTAANFCASCGCESDGDPTPSPPDDCKEDDDKIVLTDEGELKCKKIKSQALCDEKVQDEGGKTAAGFCISCGCESGGDFAPSPPDDCKEDDYKIVLTDEGELKCKKFKSQVLFDEKVQDEGGKTAANFVPVVVVFSKQKNKQRNKRNLKNKTKVVVVSNKRANKQTNEQN